MTGEGEEIAIEILDVDRHVRNALRPIEDRDRAGGVGLGNHLLRRIDRAKAVADMGEGDKFRPLGEQFGVVLLVDPAIWSDPDMPEPGPLFLGDQLPRHDVRVVLHCGEHDQVARFEIRPAPTVGDEVDRLGRVPYENAFSRGLRVDERGDRLPRRLELGGRNFGKLVDPSMDIRVVLFVVGTQGVNHDLRFL